MLAQAKILLKKVLNESFVDKDGKTVNYFKAKCEIQDRNLDTQTITLSMSKICAETSPRCEQEYIAHLELQFNDKGKVSACRIVGLE